MATAYYHDEPDPQTVKAVEERVWQRLLDAFYPMPTWYQWTSTNTVRSFTENLPAYGVTELLELRWDDIDLERGTVAIRRTLTRGVNGLTYGEPKSKAGRRSIALPDVCVSALRTHRIGQLERRLQFDAAWQDTGLVFDRGDGSMLHPNTMSKTYHRLIVKAGLPRIRFHDLRHTAATLMLANGEHPKIVQERPGHSDISMTLNRYSHVTMDMQRDASDRLAKLLSG